jgi:redox-sensitive bicupin YhaK (pirin superfamily)
MSAVLKIFPLGFTWPARDPFLFCVHHEDSYPAGDAAMGPAASLDGRDLGQDFDGKDGWRMYHGTTVPGFPAHPHRGFETVTMVRRGLVDHADSLGAAARYGHGDVQWLTAGRGLQHAEMFPLVERERPNPLELFQIWLNLPSADKLVDPHFAMLWKDAIPQVVAGATTITLTAGGLGEVQPPPPPPRSWAARPEADVAIWTIAMAPGARWTLPAARPGTNRTLYLFRGAARLDGGELPPYHGAAVRPDVAVELEAGGEPVELLLLQGRPIGEPVAQHGPFVMNSRAEIQQAFLDYQRTRFGGWPWDDPAPVHGRDQARFARHADGRLDEPARPPRAGSAAAAAP